MYLKLALDSSLINAGMEAEKQKRSKSYHKYLLTQKKVKIIQQTFVNETACANWEESTNLYPQHTSDNIC